jgi:membrane glycosyltransferase
MRARKRIQYRLRVHSGSLQGRWKFWQRGSHPDPHEEAPWERVAHRRMRIVRLLGFLTTVLLTILSNEMLTGQHLGNTARIGYLVTYATMMFFMAGSFYKTLFGAWFATRGPKDNPWHPEHFSRNPEPEDRVAVLFPVYHEDVARVAAGIAACYQSLKREAPELCANYDFFMISDSRSNGYRLTEMAAVYELRHQYNTSQFYYRFRPVNSNAKLGNVTDFFRRYGADYPYVLVMDADSIMDGSAMAKLLRMMVGNPRIAILQTNPRPILRKTIFGRMMQFAAHLYGSVFSYSMQAMNMGHAIYIGHNAMIRTEPFIKHAILPNLKGKKPWGGKPLSHDIIEAVAVGRAGYEVWFLPEITGSFEEIPANMVGFLVRERRWMVGNLQHVRFWFLNGLKSIHKETLVQGVMAYFSAPLWFVFLLISGYSVINFLHHATLTLSGLGQFRVPAVTLLASTMVFLFLPRMLAVLANISGKKAYLYGGKMKLLFSVAMETVFSFFWSPVMMVFISLFFWQWIRRKDISWGTQDRGDTELTISQSWEHFGKVSLFGIVLWGILIHYTYGIPYLTQEVLLTASLGWMHPADLLFWYFLVLGGISLAVWMARWTSFDGGWFLRKRMFIIPEEVSVPKVVTEMLSLEEFFRKRLPDMKNFQAVWNFVLSDHVFVASHLPETRTRPKIRQRFLRECRAAPSGTCYQLEHSSWYWISDRETYIDLCSHRFYANMQPIT